MNASLQVQRDWSPNPTVNGSPFRLQKALRKKQKGAQCSLSVFEQEMLTAYANHEGGDRSTTFGNLISTLAPILLASGQPNLSIEVNGQQLDFVEELRTSPKVNTRLSFTTDESRLLARIERKLNLNRSATVGLIATKFLGAISS